MKKTCNKCLASDWETGYYICTLGYNIDIVNGVPKENCPKPLTNTQLINAEHKRILTGAN